jgi:hypothetical protein
MELARRTAHSPFHSSGMAPMSRTMASSFCMMPTTSVLRLISPFERSRGRAESSRGENQRQRPCPCGREGSSSHWSAVGSSVGSSLANRLIRKIADARQKPLAWRAAPWQAASRAACFRHATSLTRARSSHPRRAMTIMPCHSQCDEPHDFACSRMAVSSGLPNYNYGIA